MRKLGGARRDEESNVDLTPMLDVVFILLIIFVVTATFLSEQAIDAASSDRSDTPPPEEQLESQNILVELGQNNEIILNGEPRPVTLNQVRPNLDRLRAENPAATVIIRPHARSNVETLVVIMDSARQAGIMDISIVEP